MFIKCDVTILGLSLVLSVRFALLSRMSSVSIHHPNPLSVPHTLVLPGYNYLEGFQYWRTPLIPRQRAIPLDFPILSDNRYKDGDTPFPIPSRPLGERVRVRAYLSLQLSPPRGEKDLNLLQLFLDSLRMGNIRIIHVLQWSVATTA